MLQIISRRPAGDGFPAGVFRLDYRSGVDGYADWAMVWPGETRDWAVVLHGHGSHGDQLYARADIRECWLPEYRGAGLGILTPNLRDNAWMNPAAVADLHDLTAWLAVECGVGRKVFASGSMGGTGNLIYAACHPEDVDVVVARGEAVDLSEYYHWLRRFDGGIQNEIADALVAAYGGTPEEQSELYRRHSAINNISRLAMPVYFLHGEADQLMPIGAARRFAVAMAREHADFHFREIPDGGHDSPLAVDCGFDCRAWAAK